MALGPYSVSLMVVQTLIAAKLCEGAALPDNMQVTFQTPVSPGAAKRYGVALALNRHNYHIRYATRTILQLHGSTE